MSKKEIKIIKEQTEFEKYFRVDSAAIEETTNGVFSGAYNRYKLTRPNASAVLVYNQDTQKIILVRQFRYPIAHKVSENILEIVAGKIDSGESPSQAAVRELKEEVGYEIDVSLLKGPIEMYPAPGYSTETIYIYMAIVNNSHKTGDGGGVICEHENINVIELSIHEFRGMIGTNAIKDSKTIISSSLLQHVII